MSRLARSVFIIALLVPALASAEDGKGPHFLVHGEYRTDGDWMEANGLINVPPVLPQRLEIGRTAYGRLLMQPRPPLLVQPLPKTTAGEHTVGAPYPDGSPTDPRPGSPRHRRAVAPLSVPFDLCLIQDSRSSS